MSSCWFVGGPAFPSAIFLFSGARLSSVRACLQLLIWWWFTFCVSCTSHQVRSSIISLKLPKKPSISQHSGTMWYHWCGGKFWIAHFSASSNFLNGICHCPLQWSNTAQCLGSVVSSSAGNGQVGFFPFCFDTKGIPVHQGDSHLPLGEARVSSFYLVSANDYTLFVVLHFVIYSQF